jgi:plastocyanin
MLRSVVRTFAGTLLAFALCSGAFASPVTRPAQAAATWQVVAGTDSKDGAVTVNAFLPTKITINAGDTVTWAFRGFHTVSFLSGGAPPPIAVPSGEGNLLMLNPAILFPAGGPSYDGTGYVNSGPPSDTVQSFSLTFSKAGTYTYLCLIHPGQDGTVVVQAEGSATESQDVVTARGNTELYSKLAHGNDLIANARLGSSPGPNSTTTYTVLDGAGGNQVSILRFLPVDVTVKAGDSVTWVMNDPHEIHTVTFYDAAAKPPDFIEPRPQANGPPKLVLPFAAPSGGTAVTDPKSTYNSGIQANGQSYTFSFPKPGTYTYICTVHGINMAGKVTVEGAATPATLPNTGADSGEAVRLLAMLGLAALSLLLGAGLVWRRVR